MIIIYIRTSTEDQNPENQLKDCESINSYGTPTIISEQQSAWKDDKKREGFERLKLLIKKRGVEHLICWDLDRLYRNRKKLLEFFNFCKFYSCKIHSYRQQFLETLNQLPKPFDEAMHDFMLHLWGWLAEDESNKKSERVKAAIRIKDGKVLSYKGNKWGRPEINKRVIQEVYNLRTQGLSIRQIAMRVHYWDKSKNKKQLSKSAVHNIIKEIIPKKS